MESARVRAALWFAVPAVACVVAGGLVSAATALAPSEPGAWAAAYLVLVGGVAQLGLGGGQAMLAPALPSRGVLLAEVLAWNVGDAAVLAGQLLGVTPVVDLGGVLLVAALALFARGARGATVRARWPLHAFRAILLLLLVSVPVGLVLAQVRPA